jgi:hypothetical protein
METFTVEIGNFKFTFKKPTFAQRLALIKLVEKTHQGKASSETIMEMSAMVDSLVAMPDQPAWQDLLDWDQGLELMIQVASAGKVSETERKN